jgi:predicted AAA+ superfamily ATPase
LTNWGLFPDALWLDLLDPEVYRNYSARPERLQDLLYGNPLKTDIVIDEIQKVPGLLGLIHKLIEEKKGQRFIMTGSSARKLKRAGVDLLAGRAILRTLHPFMAAELGESFSLNQALKSGLVPLVLDSPDPNEVLLTYGALYLREEVQFEGLVRNVGNFSRFLEAVSFSHASLLNISHIARECQVERKVVSSYIEILEDLLLSFRLPVFVKRAKRATSIHPKFYLFDVGVFRSLRPSGPLDQPSEIDGPALEGLVAQHLRAWMAYSQSSYELYFWRTRSGVEVDFVLYGSEGIWAIEVKNTERLRPEDMRALRAFRDDYPDSHALLIYRGTERLLRGDVLCLPCEEFLKSLVPNRLPERSH